MLGSPTHRADGLVVTFFADQNHREVFRREAPRFVMDLFHQGAGRIDDFHLELLGVIETFRADAVRAEQEVSARGHVDEVFDEDGALGAQVVHHMRIMHDVVQHVDGRAVAVERLLDALDRALNTRAKTPRLGQDNSHAVS